MPDLSVVIVTIKDEEDILPIPAFERSDFDDYELVVRDDEGIATARNEGVKEAAAEKIVFVDDDAEPEEGYLRAAADVLASEHAVVGRVIHPGDGMISRLATNYRTGDEGKYVDKVVGCNMGFRREVFEKVGYFDENYTWGNEETEFVKRVKREFPIYYEPEMAVVHPYATGIREYWRKQYRFGPTDVYRERQHGRSDVDILTELLNPLWYLNSDPTTWPAYVPGRLYNSLSRIRALRETRSG